MLSFYAGSILKNTRTIFCERQVLIKHKFSSKSKQHPTFSDFIEHRRQQAIRSIVVQVHSENSFKDLYSYCSKYGDIIGAHHYKINDANSNYILIEYKSKDCLDEVLCSASHSLDLTGVPAHSPLLWFKATGNMSDMKQNKSISYDNMLKVCNGVNQLTEIELQKLILSSDNISQQIEILYESTKLNDLEIRLRFLAAKQIETSISGIFPYACALPFGSSVNGFGKRGCDLDLVLCFKKENLKTNNNSRLVFHTKDNLTNERSQIQKQMESISDILQIFLPGVTHVRRILQARVPIIKFHHLLLNVDVDLTMSNLTGVYMSELLYIFGQIDNRVCPLIFAIRKWAQCVGLTNPSPGRWITNFSLSCLVVFFLQQIKNPVLPSIDFLNKSATPDDMRLTDNGIDCTFLRNVQDLKFKTENSNNLMELLIQFFEYYSQFDFGNRAISLNKGSCIQKSDQSAIYIVNPLEQSLNVCKNISLEECERLRIEVRNAAWILEHEVETKKKDVNNEDNAWGIAILFKNSQKTVIKPNLFFKPRIVEIKNLFDDNLLDNEKPSNSASVKNVKVLEVNIKKQINVNKRKER